MRYFLIQPTHRRFVRILRDCCNNGIPVILNNSDIDEFKALFQQRTMKAVERHQGIYRIILRAKERPLSELAGEDQLRVINADTIQFIEKRFFIAEWKHLRMTLRSSLIIPFLRWLLKLVRNRNRAKL